MPGGSVDFQLYHPDLEKIRTRCDSAYPNAGVTIHNNNDGSRSLELLDLDQNELKIMG